MQHETPFWIYTESFEHTAFMLQMPTTVDSVLPSLRAILYLDEGMQSENLIADTEDSTLYDNERYWESTISSGETYKELVEEVKALRKVV